MGEVVPFPVKNPRIKPATRRRRSAPAETGPFDLDRLAELAAMTVQIRALSRFAAPLPDGGETEVVFRGEHRRVTREQMFAWAYGLIEERDPLLTSLGPGGDMRVMRECAAAFRLNKMPTEAQLFALPGPEIEGLVRDLH